MSGGAPRHISIEQLRVMVNFMCQHVDLAAGRLRSLEARYKSKALWEELAKLLNNVEGGSRKTGYGWSKYWSDWKHKLKFKVKLFKMKGPSQVMLSRVEKRALAFLEPSFKQESESFRVYANRPPSPPVIKLEGVEINNLSSDERVSDEHSDSEDGDGDNADQSSNDPLNSITNLTSLYPKWLIDVEKKRADAELARAKAEEKRAVVAAKAAEAALMQAEALKTLAEATSNQADALMRIALVLESRLERDVFSI